MLRSLVNVDPLAELRAMDEMFDRMFGTPHRIGANQPPMTGASGALLPVDIFEKDNRFIVKAAVPGVKPEDLDVSIENQVLTIRGELKQNADEEDAKVYRREYSYGAFSRSIRLPENLNLEAVDAEFNHGFVVISLPKREEEKPRPLRVPIRTAQEQTKAIEQSVETPQS